VPHQTGICITSITVAAPRFFGAPAVGLLAAATLELRRVGGWGAQRLYPTRPRLGLGDDGLRMRCGEGGASTQHFLLALLLSGGPDPSDSRLIFESVSHLGSLPGARADADFLLSFFEIDDVGTRFVVAKAPNGSVLTSITGGVSWSMQNHTAIPVGSYAALPTVYENLGGWPPKSGLPLSYDAVTLAATYEPPAPANFTYTGTLVTLSAERQAPCLKLPSRGGHLPAVGSKVSWSGVSHDTSLCAFPSNGSITIYDGHVCAAHGSIRWDNMTTPYLAPYNCLARKPDAAIFGPQTRPYLIMVQKSDLSKLTRVSADWTNL
jgi:hypothetical protein